MLVRSMEARVPHRGNGSATGARLIGEGEQAEYTQVEALLQVQSCLNHGNESSARTKSRAYREVRS
jgi:hypothetical protein